MRWIGLAAVLGLAGCAASPPERVAIRLVDEAFFELVGLDPRAIDDHSEWQALLRRHFGEPVEGRRPEYLLFVNPRADDVED